MEIVDRRYCTREMVSGSQATIKNSDTCLTHFWQVSYGCPAKYYCFTSVWRLQFWMLDVFHTSFEDCHTQNTIYVSLETWQIVASRYCRKEYEVPLRQQSKKSETRLTHFRELFYGCPAMYCCFMSVWRRRLWMQDVFHTKFEDSHSRNMDLRQSGHMASRCKM